MRSIFGILTLLLITGCSTFSGVNQRTTTDIFPPPEQIEELLYSLPEIDNVTFYQDEVGDPENRNIRHSYHYSSGRWTGYNAVLYLRVDGNGSITHSQSIIGTYPPSTLDVEILRTMFKVKNMIESKYGFADSDNYSERYFKPLL